MSILDRIEQTLKNYIQLTGQKPDYIIVHEKYVIEARSLVHANSFGSNSNPFIVDSNIKISTPIGTMIIFSNQIEENDQIIGFKSNNKSFLRHITPN